MKFNLFKYLLNLFYTQAFNILKVAERVDNILIFRDNFNIKTHYKSVNIQLKIRHSLCDNHEF